LCSNITCIAGQEIGVLPLSFAFEMG
jgi:hypothetical protein